MDLKTAAARLADAFWPPRCLLCGGAVDDVGGLCPSCWAGVQFLGPPMCPACGTPFDHDPGDGLACGACLRDPPPFARARAVFGYDEHSRPLLLAFKHADRIHAAPAFGRWMARAGAELLDGADVIVPVPLHWTRLFRRRYNQAALLGHAIGRLCHVPVAVDVLVRNRRTPTLGHLSVAARRRTVQGAFAVPAGRRGRIAGKRVVLIDDVMTSGATVKACTRVLLRGGARSVDVLTLARVVAPTREG